MFSNCSVEKIIHENVNELIYVTDLKYVMMILIILLGLKFRKLCKKGRESTTGSIPSV